MKKTPLVLASLLFVANWAFSQSKYVEVGVGIGAGSLSPVVGLQKDFGLGKKKKLIVGTGIRYTGFFGKDITFTSAPNELAIDLI